MKLLARAAVAVLALVFLTLLAFAAGETWARRDIEADFFDTPSADAIVAWVFFLAMTVVLLRALFSKNKR